MVMYEPVAQVKGSPVFRVVAHIDGHRVGELWCFTNEPDDGKPPGYWYYRSADRRLYGYRAGPLAFGRAQIEIENYVKESNRDQQTN